MEKTMENRPYSKNEPRLAGFIPQHHSVNGPRGLRRGDSAVGIFHKVEFATTGKTRLGGIHAGTMRILDAAKLHQVQYQLSL